jgi:class 3 adenylate cyclase
LRLLDVFVSCAGHDEAAVESLVDDLRRARAQVSLAGGEPSWSAIGEKIRRCTVFVFAVSDSGLDVNPCLAELSYAKSLGLPILPVQVGEVSPGRIDPVLIDQSIDYRGSSRTSVIDLISALHERAGERGELPNPLPELPAMPREHLQRLAAFIYQDADLPESAQTQLLAELRSVFGEEQDQSVRDDVHRLLRALRERNDVSYQVARNVDAALAAELSPKSAPAQPDPPVLAAAQRTGAGIDDLLDRAVTAINRGDREAASVLAGQVLAVDDGNAEAEDLLAAPANAGEIRRLTIMFADLVDSTVLSTRVEPETYRLLVGRYREQVLRIVDSYEGHVGSTKGDGLLVVFGYPTAHENDVSRAVQAGLEITREVARLSEQSKRKFDLDINVRVGVHRGLVYLDTAQDDVYGLAANLAARVSGLAPPGSVVVSDAVEPLIRTGFEIESMTPAHVKGVEDPITHFRVIGERSEAPHIPIGPVVGRDRELARLRKSWARAQAGTLTTPGVVFRGEAGIGKSRLASAATELVKRDDGVVLELGGSPFHPDAGLHPVRTLLERRCRIERHTEPAQRLQLLHSELVANELDPEITVPLLGPVLGIAPEHGYRTAPAEGRKLQELITDALKRYLLACLGRKSGLILAEDAHWFDPSTLELLNAVLAATDGRLLVVITGRDGSWLGEDWPVKLFDLKPLSDEECDELIQALDPTVTAEECASVRRRCDGVPFYIEQVVGGLGSAPDGGERPSVPDPLYEPLFARLLTTPSVVPVVEAAAVIGRHVDRDLLLAVTSLDEDDVDDVIDHLEGARVLEPDGMDSWRFRHELLREVAAELAPPSVRRGLHSKVADALIEGAADDPDWRLVAGHYEHAERYADAASAYRKASEDARRRGGLAEARTFLDRALAQLEKLPPGPERDRLEVAPRLERGSLASAAEGYQSPAVAADFERCLQLTGTDLRDDQAFATLLAVSSYYISRADLRRALQLLDALRTGSDEERQWLNPAIEGALGMVAFLRGDLRDAREHFEQARVGVVEDDEHRMRELWFIPHDAVAIAYEHLGFVHVFHGNVAAAEVALAGAVQRAGEMDFPDGPYNHVYAIDMEIIMRVEASQFDRARSLAADMIERAERYGFDFWQMFGVTEQAMIDSCDLLAGGDYEATALSAQIDSLTPMVDLWRNVGLNAYQTQYDCVIARLLTAAGRPEEARARIGVALELASATEMHFYDAELLRARAHIHTDPDKAAADLAAAIELARRQDNPLFELRAALDDFEMRGEQASEALASAAELFDTDSVMPEYARARRLLGTAKLR